MDASSATGDVMALDALMDTEPLDLDELAAQTSPDDLATMIYTSGTTGPAKAVMLDHHNVVCTVESLRRCITFDEYVGKKVISYLPMAHIAERMTSHYQQAVLGFTVTTCPDFNQIATYAREVHPNVLFGVPRVWEKVYAGVNAALAAEPDRKAQVRRGDRGRDPDRREEGVGHRDRRRSSRRGTSSTQSRSARCAGSSASTSSTSPSPARRRCRPRSSPGSARSACRSPRSTACPRARAR